MTAPSFVAGPGLGEAKYAKDVKGCTRPDVHVVPLADIRLHTVPGGYPEETAEEVAAAGEPWLAIETEEGAPGLECLCFPSVRAVRSGTNVGRVLVHHAHDMRPSGQEPE